MNRGVWSLEKNRSKNFQLRKYLYFDSLVDVDFASQDKVAIEDKKFSCLLDLIYGGNQCALVVANSINLAGCCPVGSPSLLPD